MKFKKSRKIYRILFPKKYSPLDTILNKLNSNNIKSINKKDDYYEVLFYNNIKIIVRDEDHSDIMVFNQIFNFEEYSLVSKLMKLNPIFNPKKIIIDAGANVGYTSVYLSNIFENSQIFAIEPSLENAQFYKKNISSLKNKDYIKLYQNALSHESGLNFIIDRNFRDGKDWSIATNENPDGNIPGISIQEIVKENHLTHISLLKIDIEGAERFIFKDGNDFSFLKITEIIAIEIHDEFNIRDEINNILINNNFIIFESGELTIGINKLLI